MSLLQAKDLVKQYGTKTVVDGVSIEVNPGEVVGLLGPNGAGKTTSFKMIVGRIQPSSGKVFFAGEEVTNMPMYKRSRLGMGYLAQEPSIFDGLNVRDNLLAILEFYEKDRKKRKEKLEMLLEKLGLSEHVNTLSSKLSGGLRRRLEITRALITQPKLILLDEPFAGVDPLVVEDIQNIVRILKADGLGLLITDHNVPATLHITDRAYIIQNGNILVSGTAEDIASSEIARREYLGKNFSLK
ncbi:MAG: LPS export ABC transporter ATP-binding protein [Planctomycetes bacterium]|nr:LPS export ABC transporter ATP-binding protein [Planctomycetota bacterium]